MGRNPGDARIRDPSIPFYSDEKSTESPDALEPRVRLIL